LSEQEFEQLIKVFETDASQKYFTHSSESNLLRIITHRYDRVLLLQDCIKYPHYVESLIGIAINSNYLTDILIRNPEFFYRFVNPSDLEYKLEEESFKKTVKDTILVFKSFKAKVNSLRSLKRRETLRIGLKDILGKSELSETVFELSVLARSISVELFSICYNETLSKYGIQKTNHEYCIIALGKLGGYELNYSSDIDLIIVYDKDSTVKNKQYSEILNETVLLFIDSATSLTDTGYIYRIDFRLRPDGRNSPLCKTYDEFINYYETRGEDWERQMLIKASFLTGSHTLYDKLINYLSHFIYPSTFFLSPQEQIKQLKRNIEKRLTGDENIKLIPGGIRDIEFSVQALQLINGGKNSNLITNNTLDAINRLEKEKLLSTDEAETLRNAYILYRRVEHYLQLMNDIQTHSIPDKGEILEKLSSFLSFKNNAEFKRSVKIHRSKVEKIFNSITGSESNKVPSSPERKINFSNKSKALQNLRYLSEGTGLLGRKSADKSSILAFQKVEPDLIKYLKKSSQTDLVLQNFVRIIKEAAFPSIWYNSFNDKVFFKSFLTLIEFSQKSVDLFAEDKDLREHFLSKRVFEKLDINSFQAFSVKKILFTLSVQFTLNKIEFTELSKSLSDYFRFRISNILEGFVASGKITAGYFIAGLGSFSTKEMTFASDIDLIFVVDKLDSKGTIQREFQNILLKLKDEFAPFTVDCRLRPEGKSSLLVWEFKSYAEYLKSRARIWELQAFTKLSFVCGEKKLFTKFLNIISNRAENESKTEIKKEMAEMRKRTYPRTTSSFNIKKSRGGITDIEFVIQFLILCNPGLFKKSSGNNIVKNITILSKRKTASDKLIKLKESFSFLKTVELLNQNIFNNSLPIISYDDVKTQLIAQRMNIKNKGDFLIRLQTFTKLNQNMFDKFLR
jgi:glutamate-ammonia-ligase adenylyltransferase